MITQEQVRELFLYEDGNLFWQVHRSNTRIGSMVGCRSSSGYLHAKIDNKLYLVHRLVFLYHFGYLPENDIDHIDKCRMNNKIENLREVSKSCNARNSTQQSQTSSGIKGLSWYKPTEKWLAHIRVNSISRYLGRYSDFTEAVAHRLAAEQCLEWGSCDSSSPAYQFMKDYCEI
jgi:hypothetical protein